MNTTVTAFLVLGLGIATLIIAFTILYKFFSWVTRPCPKVAAELAEIKRQSRVKRIGELRSYIKQERKAKLRELKLENWAKKELTKA